MCKLSGVKQQVNTLLSNPSTHLTSFLEDTSQIQNVSSAEPVRRNREFGENRHTRTTFLCPCRTVIMEPESTSQRKTLQSVEAVASIVPNGEKLQEFTLYVCPSNGDTDNSLPFSIFHNRTDLSPELEAKTLLLGEKLHEVTSVACFAKVLTSTAIWKKENNYMLRKYQSRPPSAVYD